MHTASLIRPRSFLRVALFAGAAIVVVNGCGASGTSSGETSSGSSSGGSSGTSSGTLPGDGGQNSNVNVTAEEACTRYVDAARIRYETCFPKTYVGVLNEGDRAVQLAFLKAKCLASISADGSNTKPADVATCANTLNAASCVDLYTGNAAQLELDRPWRCTIPRGTKPSGSPCSVSAQCKGFCKRSEYYMEEAVGKCGTCVDYVEDGAACERKDGAPPCVASSYCSDAGKCEKLPRFGVGESCTTFGLCAPDLFCSTVSKKCEPRVKAGGSCMDTVDCEPDYVCDHYTGDKCVPKATDGQPCQAMGTSGGFCASGHVCVGAGQNSVGTCKAYVNIEPGGACSPASGKRCRQSFCSGGNSGPGECPKLADKGQACSGFSGAQCKAPYTCLNEQCVEAAPPTCN